MPKQLISFVFALLPLLTGAPALAQDAEPESIRPVESPELIEGQKPQWMPDSAYLGPAYEAAKWLRSVAVETEHGLAWRADPSDEDAPFDISLYSGAPGVILYFIDIARVSGREEYFETARRGGDDLIARLPETLEGPGAAGLYTGAAGQSFVLEKLFQVTGDARYLAAADRLLEQIVEAAEREGAGVQWGQSTDIISGGAGIGLFLLHVQRGVETIPMRGLVNDAAARLIEVGVEDKGGLKWPLAADSERFMPNFSHGTAGVAYFLATNVIFTADEASRSAAIAGGRYLDNVADTSGGGRKILHHENGGEELFYLSWCHGPAGTARTYLRLHQVTGEQKWMDAVFEAAKTIESCGLPGARTPGYWENVSLCCGGAGVLDFYMDLYTHTRDEKWLKLAETMADDLVERATNDENGMRWAQAEHRTKPEDVRTQVGLMQGAAGVGRALLRIEAMARRCDCLIKLPDTPF